VVASTSCDAVPEDVPWGHLAEVRGNAVTLRWNPPLAGTGPDYVLEASADDGATYPYQFPLGAATTLTTTAPSGRYLTRVRAVQGGVASAPSVPIEVRVGTALEPPQVRNLLTAVAGSSVAIVWNLDEPGGTATEVEFLAGSAPGLRDIAELSLPPGTTALTADNVPAGVYYIRVRQIGATGLSDPPESVQLAIPAACAAPDPPPFLAVTRQAGGYLFTWELGPIGSPAPTSWILHAGTAPGLSDLAVLPVGQRQFFAPVPPSGTYYVRVVAGNGCGISGASNEVPLVIP
jgi:hypothetical protein